MMPRPNRFTFAALAVRYLGGWQRAAAEAKQLKQRLLIREQELSDRDEAALQLRYDIAALSGENEILKAQLAMFERWRAQEQEWHEAEAAIQAQRKASALGMMTQDRALPN